jgi:phospholipase C
VPRLADVSITFDTHDDNKDAATVVHVFVKNRLSTSKSPESDSDFISNWLAHQRYQADGDLSDSDRNPYLAYGLNLSKIDPPVPVVPGVEFDDRSSHTFSLTLSSDEISSEDIVLPAVNVHILPAGNDRWIFDYSITFTFDDTSAFTYSSKNDDGINGIILDQGNRDYSGICAENPFRKVEPLVKPVTDSVLKKVTIGFATHDDNRDADTRLNVRIVNRLSPTSNQDIAIGLDLFHGEELADSGPGHYKSFSWSSDDGTLAAHPTYLRDIVLPMAYIVIAPNGNDRWIFDYEVTFEFSDPDDFEQKRQIYSWRTNGIILDQDNNKYGGVYQGRPFPAQAEPPTAPVLADQPVDRKHPPKTIPIALLRRKFDEFLNHRNGPATSHNPPLRRIRLDNSGETNLSVLRESYADVQSIAALTKRAPQPKVTYESSPRSLGQLTQTLGIGDLYLNDINMSSLSLTVDPAQTDGPFLLTIVFDTGGSQETVGGIGGMDFTTFEIALKLTLGVKRTTNEVGAERTVVDVMSWVDEVEALWRTATQVARLEATAIIEKYVHVSVTTSKTLDPGGFFRQAVRDKLYGALTSTDAISGRSARDDINSVVTSWLLGGIADDDRNTDGNNDVIDGISIDEEKISISFSGPRKVFAPPAPPDWPTPSQPSPDHDFSPRSLTNIEHIVVVMMENRSFDHVLGYLSLPAEQGGAGRSDVDGLRGGESNSYLGRSYPSYPLEDTLFAPDPPHGYEPTARAINGGRMDGFAASFGNAHGQPLAGRVMGHQTAATVPAYDALARDFAIGQRWFASHPGPTFCNRFYMLTGRLNLDSRGFWEFDNSSPMRPVFTPTIFDYLSDAGHSDTGAAVSWAYFESGYCSLRFYERHTFDDEHIFTADDPEYGFYARALAGTLPSVSFLDPHYIELPPDGNCDGPPADMQAGQEFVRTVVEHIIAGPKWSTTMLLIVYDEHGGFYDHVPPPPAARVSADFPIETTGVRVPAFVISPWVGAGTVFGYDGAAAAPPGDSGLAAAHTPAPTSDLHFDHTSILKTIARRFMSASPPYMGSRYAAAEDLSSVIGDELRAPQFLPFVRYRLQFAASQMLLDVPTANPAPGTHLWQFGANGSVAQDFAFEDAGDGFVYIRSNVSNLYVTVDGAQEPQAHTAAPHPAPHGAGPAGHLHGLPLGSAAGGVVVPEGSLAEPPTTAGPHVIQDVRYRSGGVVDSVAAGRPTPELQKWRLTPAGPTVMQQNVFVISNEAYPDKLLQPEDPAQSMSSIVLGDADGSVGVHDSKNAWRVTCPLLSDQPVMTQ